MHIEAGHSTFESEPTHLKDLRCPFCLYRTKNKNNMIDHVILHRGELGAGQESVPHYYLPCYFQSVFSLLLSEERVVPIEVRRPKLSRYLQGIVFRCHKCTFTSASAENLHSHMKKHNDIKPYKCRLCYFDCTKLCDLEAHLCDKHQVSISNQLLSALLEFLCLKEHLYSLISFSLVQVVRNHALVGQVSLDQLESRVSRTPEEEEEPTSNLENDNNEVEETETEVFAMGCNEASEDTRAKNPAVKDLRENMKLQILEPRQQQRQGSRKITAENLTRSFAFNLQYKNNAAVPEKREHDPQEQAQNEMNFTDAVKTQKVQNIAEPKVAEGNNADVYFVSCSYPDMEKQMSENQLRGSVDSRKISMKQREEAAEGRLAQACKLQIKALKARTSNTEVEDDILRHILLFDNDRSIRGTPKKSGYDRKGKIEQGIEKKVVENVLNKIILLDEESSITLAQQAKKRPENRTEVTPENTMKSQEITADKLLLNLTPNCPQLKMSRNKRITYCKDKNQIYCEELDEAMPVLEKEPVKEEPLQCCEEEEGGGRLEQRQDRGDKVIIENQCQELEEGGRMKDTDNQNMSQGEKLN